MIGRRLLLLDEPFEGVAPALAQRLIEVIAGLKGRNATVLISDPTMSTPATSWIRCSSLSAESSLSSEAIASVSVERREEPRSRRFRRVSRLRNDPARQRPSVSAGRASHVRKAGPRSGRVRSSLGG